MKELQFDTGLVSYKVNGECEISFNPGDLGFIKKLFDLFETLSSQQEKASKENSDDVDGKALFEITERLDAEMRSSIDGLFGAGVADTLFKNISVFALAGGFPLWANFLMAIIDEIDSNVVQEEKKSRERVDKYIQRYKAYRKK